MKELILESLNKTLMITTFVIMMMIFIEYINVLSKRKWLENFRYNSIKQIFIGAFLGIIPGCMGSFMAVSLYTHKLMNLPGIVATMIATSGDEAYVMFAMFPLKALLLNLILFIIAIIMGFIVLKILKNEEYTNIHGYIVHEQEECICFNKNIIIKQIKSLTFERAVLIISILIINFLLIFNIIGEPGWGWEKITFLLGSIFLLFVFITVPDHFIKEHFYGHILKKHLIKIFLWTWSALLVVGILIKHENFAQYLTYNKFIILLIAVLVGIIPESGPHFIFITMYSQNLIPFSILLANSIVQDGHGMLPLLAESRKDFIKIKLINLIAGLLFGLALLLFKF